MKVKDPAPCHCRRLVLPVALLLMTAVAVRADYTTTVLGDSPLAYYPLDETGTPTADVATNNGSLGATGNGVYTIGTVHQVPGAIVGDSDTAARFSAVDTNSDDGGVPVIVPYSASINPSGSFTVEAWVRPTEDGAGNAQCPLYNHDPADVSPNRVGWDFFQRGSGTGWNFRMFNGNAHNRVFDITGGPYTVGQWSHLVAVYNASVPSATLYLNGQQVAFSSAPSGSFNPNTSFPLSIGGYSDASQNPFVGDIDEVAVYGSALSSAQVLTHYQNGTNAARGVAYSSLVTSDGAVEYLRLDDPESPQNIVHNLGSLGSTVNGLFNINASPGQTGPQPPADQGFPSTNVATYFNGTTGYIDLGNPAGLNFSKQITLEAWIQPSSLPAATGGYGDIIAHGYSDDFYETSLRADDSSGTQKYGIGNYTPSGGQNASAPIPAGDLGSATWVHLVGTYDGASWNLYRNGILIASQPDSVGAVMVTNANWAIGARGRWKQMNVLTPTPDRQFQGTVDEPAFYNHALTPSQVLAHYDIGAYNTTNVPPVIVQQPAPQWASPGGTVTFSVQSASLLSVTNLWFKNGVALPNQTNATLVLNNVQGYSAGSYSVLVGNSAGSTNSAAANLVVAPQYITWQTPQVISGAADVLTNGTYFGSWAPNDGGASSLPVNGVSFQGFSDLSGFNENFPGGGGYNGFGSPGTANANYNSLLPYGVYGGGSTASFSWGGMTPGHTYEVQFWVEDARGVTGGRWENLTGGDISNTIYGTDTSGPVGYSSPLFSGAASPGYYVVGTFMAGSSGSEQIMLNAFGISSASPQVNLFQVRDVTPPAAPLAFGGVSGAVLADGPVAYYRLNESGPWVVDTATNSGSLGTVDNGASFPGAIHQVPGAIVGDPDTAMRYGAIDTNSDDGGVPTVIPYDAALNPSTSFTIEAWLRPTEEGAGNAQCPLFNCQASTEDYGWDFYQRASVAGSGQQGWEFYMNNTTGARVGDAVGGTYTVGQWCHLVAVYDSTAATATLYVNGQQVAQATGITGYVPNPSYPMSIGGYSDGSQNPYVGDIDEFAYYNSALSAAKVLAHYQNGTNASRGVSYRSLVLSDGPAEYLRLDEPAVNVAVNSGSLGSSANGVDSNTGNPVSGPSAPAYTGFEATNLAEFFNGSSDYIELLNPPGLNFTGPITLEAWVRPSAAQNALSDVIAHGVNDTGNAEVSLRLNGTNTYQISSWDGVATYGTTAVIPAQDLGSGNWVHLVGTYDGGYWNLYRNGVLAASTAAVNGSLVVSNANWAIGARGRWKNGAGYPISGLDRQFNGAVDEVAIYNYALTPARIQSHYAESKQPFTMNYSSASRQMTLSWVLGTLVGSTNVAGPYSPVPGASSPYHPTVGTGQQFYRIQY